MDIIVDGPLAVSDGAHMFQTEVKAKSTKVRGDGPDGEASTSKDEIGLKRLGYIDGESLIHFASEETTPNFYAPANAKCNNEAWSIFALGQKEKTLKVKRMRGKGNPLSKKDILDIVKNIMWNIGFLEYGL
ncbi:hypothetical protein ACJX0J_025280, partial [Zea mays]